MLQGNTGLSVPQIFLKGAPKTGMSVGLRQTISLYSFIYRGKLTDGWCAFMHISSGIQLPQHEMVG